MFGRKPDNSTDHLVPVCLAADVPKATAKTLTVDGIITVESDLKKIRDSVLEDFKAVWLSARERSRESYDKRVKTLLNIKPGERILVWSEPYTKLCTPWKGPYFVIMVLGSGHYRYCLDCKPGATHSETCVTDVTYHYNCKPFHSLDTASISIGDCTKIDCTVGDYLVFLDSGSEKRLLRVDYVGNGEVWGQECVLKGLTVVALDNTIGFRFSSTRFLNLGKFFTRSKLKLVSNF